MMEEYKNIKRNALITYNVINATHTIAAILKGHEKKVKRQNMIIICQIEREIEKSY